MYTTGELSAVVLAAGAGTRMKSQRSKVLHRVAGRPLLHYPILAARAAGARRVIVVVSPSNQADVESCLQQLQDVSWEVAVQPTPRGTGDAVRAAMPLLQQGQPTGRTLVLCGDTPLVRAEDLVQLVAASQDVALAIATCELDDPTGYGRILRDAAGAVSLVREQKDLRSDAERALREVNAGIYCLGTDILPEVIGALTCQNAANEYYLTDIVGLLARRGVRAVPGDPNGLIGVNDRVQLAQVEEVLFRRIADRHRRAGVTVQNHVQIDDAVQIGVDSELRAFSSLRGETSIGSGVLIDHGSVIEDSFIASGAVIKPHSVVVQSRVGERCQIGPFAHLRPNSELEAEVHIGNFVETKQTYVARGAKANHLAYLGDAEIGEGANIGAGTIFCNYDGFSKWRTVIGKGAFIGSDSQLVAPVKVGEGAYVGTGTTVTQDVPDGALALSRVTQTTKLDYAPGLREKLRTRAEARKRR